MTPKQQRTRPGGMVEARRRRKIAEKYFEVAELAATEDGAAINVCVGIAILAGIAAGDAICLAAVGERYAGQDHAAAASFLERVDPTLGKRLRTLVAQKSVAHYGEHLLSSADRDAALRQGGALVVAARERTT